MAYFAVLAYVAIAFTVAALIVQVRHTREIAKAEEKMVEIIQISLKRQQLEKLRDDLLELKAEAIKIGFKPMDRFYEIENAMNLFAAKLDEMERKLIQQGLRQQSQIGRAEYMLKLINLSIA